MKNSILLAITLFIQGAWAQTYIADTLAIRILLDANGLTTLGVSEVVKTDSANRVVSLNLSGRKLLKVTPEIGAVSELRTLVLSNNLLDSLPATVWSLSHLFTLDLSDNGFKTLDARVGQLDSLLFLGLRGNELVRLPVELFGLQDLETLLIANNALDTLSENVVDLLFLKYFDLSGNALRSIPYTLAAMDQLDSLDLSANVLTDLPDLITELKSTAKVRLGGNRLCNLSGLLEEWATEKDPQYKSTQVCGMAVRPWANQGGGSRFMARMRNGTIRFDFQNQGSLPEPYEISVRTILGNLVYANHLATIGPDGFSIAFMPGGSNGFLSAELRSHGRLLAATPVLLGP
jgi:hypothetical protein